MDGSEQRDLHPHGLFSLIRAVRWFPRPARILIPPCSEHFFLLVGSWGEPAVNPDYSISHLCDI